MEFLDTFSRRAPDPQIRFGCPSGAAKKTISSCVCTKFHVSGCIVAGASLEGSVGVVSMKNVDFHENPDFAKILPEINLLHFQVVFLTPGAFPTPAQQLQMTRRAFLSSDRL